MGGVRRWTAIVVGVAALTAVAPAGAVTITEFTPLGGDTGKHGPRYIKAGPDGNIWYADGGSEGQIVRMNTRGEVSGTFGTAGKGPVDLAFAPNGTLLWAGDHSIGELPPTLIAEEELAEGGYASFVSGAGEWRWSDKFSTHGETFPDQCSALASLSLKGGRECIGYPAATGRITGLALDGAGHWWGAFYEANTLRELTAPEQVLELPENSGPVRLVLGPDRALWVTMYKASAVDRIATDGSRRRFALPAGAGPNDIAVGPEGALWVTEFTAGKIARLTTAGSLTEYTIPTAGATPIGIAAGPDGALWFTEANEDKIGRLVPDPLPAGGPGGSGGPGAGGGAASNTSLPTFTHAPAFSPSRFRSPASRHSPKLHKGSVLTFTLSEAATLKLQIAMLSPGRRVGGKCAAPSHSNKIKRRCTRYLNVGALSAKAAAGANRIPFGGRLNGHSLRPGSYRATIVAIDLAGNGSAPATAAFTIAP
jgi:hypothetical protein